MKHITILLAIASILLSMSYLIKGNDAAATGWIFSFFGYLSAFIAVSTD